MMRKLPADTPYVGDLAGLIRKVVNDAEDTCN
jgi:hypothetical protein